MWIIKDQSNTVIYLLDQEPLFRSGVLKQPIHALDIKESQVIVEQANKPDLPFVGNYFSYSNGVWSVIDQAKYDEEVYQPLIESLKEKAMQSLFANCNKTLEQLAINYPARESQTWSVQLEEANRYLADNTSPTPFISAALREGETVQQYAELIVSNNMLWSDYAGKVVLKRRTFEKRINTATTTQELNTIIEEVNNA